MLRHSRNWMWGCWLLLGTAVVIINALEPNMNTEYDNYSESTSKNDNGIRFREIQNKLLDLVGNSTTKMHSLTQLMGLMHSDTGKEMGKLVVEGLMLGIRQKDAGQTLGDFWIELQQRLSPTLKKTMKDYQDFFKGMDISTLPFMWEQLFKKDELGNSLAGLPLGQLVDLIQPTASRYGIDIRSFMDSMMGKGDNNVRDLIISAIDSANITLLWDQIMNVTTNMFQTTEPFKPSGSQSKETVGRKKDKTDKTLRLFRPLVASLLKENEVDLDADAVLQVLSPLFKTDLLSKFSPLLSMLSAQGDGGGLGPMIGNLLGAAGQGPKANPMAGILGAVGGLMAASGGKNQLDMSTILNMASAFMDQPAKKKSGKNKPKNKAKMRENDGFDLGSLMNMAGSLMGNMDMDTILDIAAASIKNEDRKVKRADAPLKNKIEKQATPSPSALKKAIQPKKETTSKYKKSPKNLIDVIEPILTSMKTDKKCNAKIRDAINLGKTMLTTKLSTFGGFKQIIPLLLSFVSNEDFLKSQGVNIDKLTHSFTQALTYADWNDFLISLENKDFREMLVQNILPNAAELVILVAAEDSQKKMYDAIVPRFQMFVAAYGLTGINVDNFPERLAPMLGLLSKSWKLPFNPTTMLVPLKVYLKGLQTWTISGLDDIRSLTPEEVKLLVKEKLENDVTEGVMNVLEVIKETSDPHSLPQKLCKVNSSLKPDSLQAAITRFVSLVSAAGPVLQTPDADLMLRTVEAIAEKYEDCEISFPGDSNPHDEEEEDEEENYEDPLAMELMYDHVEL